MKKRQINEIEITLKKLNSLIRHIKNVEDNCVLLGTELIRSGRISLGHKLIANGFIHDSSKFFGIEFENLSTNEPLQEETAKLKLKMAIQHHQKINMHHPEAWPEGIQEMPDVYLAEFCCDIKARSEEFGTDLRQWINESATKKYEFSKEDDVYKKIMGFVDLLCPKPFEKIS